jgi:hypothetical protein
MRNYELYNIDSVNKIIERDNAKLVEIPTKIHRNGTIKFSCRCGNEYEKNTYVVLKKTGAICKACTNNLQKLKTKETFIKKYGVEHVFQNKNIKEKIKQIMLKKYGVEHPLQNEEFKNKAKQTTIDKFGTEYASQLSQFKEKVKQTCLKKYGVENAAQNSIIKEKMKKTNLERYGVENAAQSQEIQEITQKNAKKYKEYKMPSGNTVKVQGYEPFALDELIKTYKEDDIKTERKEVPRITYTVNNKQRYYFPDIYIPSENKIIEVKSTWTYKSKQDNIQQKADATKKAGYDYEIWIYDSKGNKTVN